MMAHEGWSADALALPAEVRLQILEAALAHGQGGVFIHSHGKLMFASFSCTVAGGRVQRVGGPCCPQDSAYVVCAAQQLQGLPLPAEAHYVDSYSPVENPSIRMAVDVSPSIVWFRLPDGTTEYISKQWFPFVGLSHADFEGHLSDVWRAAVHPDDLVAFMEACEVGRAAGEPYETEVRLCSPSGEWRWWIVRAAPIRGPDSAILRWVGVLNDVHAKRELVRKLAEEQALFTTAIETLPVSLSIADPNGRLRLANKALKKVFGHDLPPTQSIQEYSTHWAGFHLEDGRPYEPHEWPLARSLLHGDVVDAEDLIFQRGDGSRGILRVHSAPVYGEDGHLIAGVCASEDVTSEVQSAEERARLQASEQTARSVSELMANVSHKLRSPLHGILGMAELLAGTRLTPEQAEYIAAITDSGKLLLVVINDLLDHEKLRAGRLELERIPFSLRGALRGAVALMAEPSRKKGVRVSLCVDVDADCKDGGVVGDPQRLKQIVVNLLSNSIRFTPAGGTVEVEARVSRERTPKHDASGAAGGSPSAPQLLPAAGAAEGPVAAAPASASPTNGKAAHVQLQVRDTGIGMDASTLERLFTPWTQADSSTTRRYGGTGLGLAICKQLAALMGGSITAHSDGPGRGTTMTVQLRLPLCSAEELRAASVSASPNLAARQPSPGEQNALGDASTGPLGASPAPQARSGESRLSKSMASLSGALATLTAQVATPRNSILSAGGTPTPPHVGSLRASTARGLASGRQTASAPAEVCPASPDVGQPPAATARVLAPEDAARAARAAMIAKPADVAAATASALAAVEPRTARVAAAALPGGVRVLHRSAGDGAFGARLPFGRSLALSGSALVASASAAASEAGPTAGAAHARGRTAVVSAAAAPPLRRSRSAGHGGPAARGQLSELAARAAAAAATAQAHHPVAGHVHVQSAPADATAAGLLRGRSGLYLIGASRRRPDASVQLAPAGIAQSTGRAATPHAATAAAALGSPLGVDARSPARSVRSISRHVRCPVPAEMHATAAASALAGAMAPRPHHRRHHSRAALSHLRSPQLRSVMRSPPLSVRGDETPRSSQTTPRHRRVRSRSFFRAADEEGMRQLALIASATTDTEVREAPAARSAAAAASEPPRPPGKARAEATAPAAAPDTAAVSGAASSAPAEPAQAATSTPAQAAVLVVDDSRINALLTSRLLRNAGYSDVTVAEDGRQAVEAVLARPTPFAAILMDCQMPVMDGYEATRRIRSLPDADKASVPVIALTASALRADVERSAVCGMDDHLSKPCSATTLLAKVAHWTRVAAERRLARASAPIAAAHPETTAAAAAGDSAAATAVCAPVGSVGAATQL